MCKVLLELIHPELKKLALDPLQVNFLADTWLQNVHAPESGHTGFSVVRNPLARLVSVYREIFEKESPYPFIYQNYLGGILPKNLSFESFVMRISEIPDYLKDQHFTPQHQFLKPYQRMGHDIKIFKLEDSIPLQNFLSNIGMELPHLNKGNVSDYSRYYSQKSLETAWKMYAHDFELFDYEHKLS